MVRRFSVLASLLMLGLAVALGSWAKAEPQAQPDPALTEVVQPQQDYSQPASTLPATTLPATGPATTRSATTRSATTVPTASKATPKDDPADALGVAYFELDGPISERPEDFSLFASSERPNLQQLIERILTAGDDPEIHGLLLNLNGVQVGLAQAQELRNALALATQHGKKVYTYADSYDTDSYTIATGASDICLMTGGELELPGVGVETLFAKGLLDKVGVQADYIQIGEFKGADEQFTRNSASPELAGELNRLTESLYGQIVDGISEHRALPRQRVRQLIDQVMIDSQESLKAGLIDHVIELEDMRSFITKDLQGDIHIIHGYGEPEEPEIDLSNIFSILASINREAPAETGPQIGVIYVDGTIVDGEGGQSLTGESAVGSDEIRRALRLALRDEQVKAVVIRIDSPGGSALASEAIWQAIRRVNDKKPVVVSVGGMAASGGYYIASAADEIYADHTAIVGSIGVVGGKFVLKDLYEKLGLTTEVYSQGANATLFSSNSAWTPEQRERIHAWMQKTYEQFTQRILTTRRNRIVDIDKVARGRIFVAPQAKNLGLVDELGGLDDAIQYAAGKVKLEVGDYKVRSIPAPRTLADLLNGRAESAAPLRRAMANELAVGGLSSEQFLLWQALPADARQLILQQVQFAKLLNHRPVVLCAPYVVQIR